MKNNNLQTVQVPIKDLTKADYNPRKWDEKALNDLKASIKKFGLVDPIIINSAKNRKNVVRFVFEVLPSQIYNLYRII
jgi:ParB-like chromosome segregation protein Spo0J